MNKLLRVLYIVLVLSGCVNTPTQFRPAGFQSADEAKEYVPDYLYYAKKLTAEEWEAFYGRFPEYWKDIQTAKTMGSSLEFHPWYTAYSFRWNTLRKKEHWDPATLSRLENRQVQRGDDVFKVILALGAPGRVVWDNDFEILAYKSDSAMIFANGVFDYSAKCPGCFKRYRQNTREGMLEKEVIDVLRLKRPQEGR